MSTKEIANRPGRVRTNASNANRDATSVHLCNLQWGIETFLRCSSGNIYIGDMRKLIFPEKQGAAYVLEVV